MMIVVSRRVHSNDGLHIENLREVQERRVFHYLVILVLKNHEIAPLHLPTLSWTDTAKQESTLVEYWHAGIGFRHTQWNEQRGLCWQLFHLQHLNILFFARSHTIIVLTSTGGIDRHKMCYSHIWKSYCGQGAKNWYSVKTIKGL